MISGWSEAYAFAVAVLSFGLGALLITIGARAVRPRVTRSAGPFDLALGLALVLVGVAGLLSNAMLWMVTDPVLLVALYLFREYYVLADKAERRTRDAANAVLLGGPVALGFFPYSSAVALSVLVSMFLSGVAGVGFLLRDGIRRVAGDEVYGRDVVAALLMVTHLIALYLAISIGLTRMPP